MVIYCHNNNDDYVVMIFTLQYAKVSFHILWLLEWPRVVCACYINDPFYQLHPQPFSN